MRRLVVLLALLICYLPGPGYGQAYPERPIRMIVPNGPGGGTDTFARIIGGRLASALGQPVLVENRPGAQGNIGTALGARAAPDGYTITVAFSSMVINPFLYTDVGFDPLKDFAPVALGVEQPYLVAVNPSVPVSSLQELVTLAKAKPNKLSYASTSSQIQLIGALFQMLTGAEMLYVPYKNASAAVVDLMSGQVDVQYASLASTIPLVKAGKLKALAVTGDRRASALPATPTAKESGYPDFDVTGWYGFVVPAATPKDIVAKLNRQINLILEMQDVKESLRASGFEPHGSTADEFGALIRKDHARWGLVVKSSGIKVQ